MKRAAFDIATKEPFYYHALRQMVLQPSKSVPTAGVSISGSNILLRYNPEWFNSLENDGSKAFLVMHEIQHVILGHLKMTDMEDHTRKNIAQDILINDCLRQYFKTPPKVFEGGVKPESYKATEKVSWRTHTVRQVYDLLESEKNLEDPHHGKLVPRDEPSDADVDAAIKQLMKGFDNSLPQEFRDLPDELTKTRINWRSQIFRFSLDSISEDLETTWTRPSRRFGFEAKGRRKVRIPNLLVAVDNSGSIDPDLYAKFISEVRHLLSFVPEIHFVACDTQINLQRKLYRKLPKFEEVNCGGGTDLSPPFDYARKHGIKNVIYFTDGEAATPENMRGIRTMFVLPEGGTQHEGVMNVFMRDFL
jgi:predicted metal-dependent peptidase